MTLWAPRPGAEFALTEPPPEPAVEPLLSVYGLGPEKKGTLKKVGDKVKGRLTYLPPRDEAALWALSLIGDEKAEQTFLAIRGRFGHLS